MTLPNLQVVRTVREIGHGCKIEQVKKEMEAQLSELHGRPVVLELVKVKNGNHYIFEPIFPIRAGDIEITGTFEV